jgi:O-antigen/teichoic acid export membrane protein
MRSLLRRGWALGLPHLVLALVSIQGAAYIVQFAIARLVTPGDFGIVRTVESAFSLALVVASAGLPSLAIKSVAMMETQALQGRLLRRLVSLVMVTSLVTAVIVSAGAPLFVSPAAARWLSIFIFALIPVAVARTCTNFFQALGIVKRVSIVVASGSAVGVVTVVFLVARYGLTGWIAGRYVAECLLAVVALLLCLPYLRSTDILPSSVRRRALLMEGGAVSSSLLVRSAIDNVPVLSLGWFAIAATDIGYFGLGSIIAGALLLIPAAMNSLAISRLVASLRAGHDAARRLFTRLQLAAALMTVPAMLALMVALPPLVERVAPRYSPGIGVLRALVAVVPLRGMTTTSGGLLLAAGRISLGLWFNIATLMVCLAALAVLVPRYGVTGAASAIIFAEATSALLFCAGALRSIETARVSLGSLAEASD